MDAIGSCCSSHAELEVNVLMCVCGIACLYVPAVAMVIV